MSDLTRKGQITLREYLSMQKKHALHCVCVIDENYKREYLGVVSRQFLTDTKDVFNILQLRIFAVYEDCNLLMLKGVKIAPAMTIKFHPF